MAFTKQTKKALKAAITIACRKYAANFPEGEFEKKLHERL
jgi:hypothetical protein